MTTKDETTRWEDEGDSIVDITGILSSVKGKVLDAENYGRLKGIYDLQNENIEQLTRNNELLKEEVVRQRQEIKSLKTEVAELKSKVETLPRADELDENEKRILVLLSHGGRLSLPDIAAGVSLNPTKTEYYLEELEKKNFVSVTHYSTGYSGRPPSQYELRTKGRAYLVRNGLAE